MKFTYYGHSCFAVEINGCVLLFDPYITPNDLAKDIKIDTIKADYIFLSHGHFDHMTDAIPIAERTGALVVAGWELYNWLNGKGLKKTFPLNPGGKRMFEFGLVQCVIAQHSNSLPDGTYGGCACGFVIYSEEGNFYYSGDTALTEDMRLIGTNQSLDFAVLPVGGLLTMGAEEAIVLAKWLNIEKVIGVHFDTFDFIKIDHTKTKQAFERAGVLCYLPFIGQKIEFTNKRINMLDA